MGEVGSTNPLGRAGIETHSGTGSLIPGCPLPDEATLRPILEGLPPRVLRAIEELGASRVGDLRSLSVGDFLAQDQVSWMSQARLRTALGCADPACGTAPPKGRTSAKPTAVPVYPVLDADTYPEWFMAAPLAKIRMPHGLRVAIRHLKTVGDVTKLSARTLRGGKNLGPTAPDRLRRHVHAAYEAALARRENPPEPRGWPEADVATLRAMWAAGESASRISRALDGRFSRSAVIAKASKLRLVKDGPIIQIERRPRRIRDAEGNLVERPSANRTAPV